MNKELEAIEALGYKHEAIRFFALGPPCHVFEKVFGDKALIVSSDECRKGNRPSNLCLMYL